MLVSLITPAFNEAKLLGTTLANLQSAAQTAFHPAGWAFECIVCNNNSTDETAAVALAAGARVVFEPINQISRARNTGAAAAQGDWFIFVDADSKPTAALLRDVADAIRSHPVIGGGTTLRFDQAPLGGRIAMACWNAISRIAKVAAGSFLFCEAEAFRQVQGFDNTLFASEELSLSRRLRQFGRTRSRHFVILTKHPMTTSARKLSLYTPREHLRILVSSLLRPQATLRNRDACHLWYDGRR